MKYRMNLYPLKFGVDHKLLASSRYTVLHQVGHPHRAKLPLDHDANGSMRDI